MIAAIHIRKSGAAGQRFTCAALTWFDNLDVPQTALFRREGTSTQVRYGVGLDAVEHLLGVLRSSNSTAVLHVSDAGLRGELTTASGSFPSLELIETARGPLLCALVEAANQIGLLVRRLQEEFEAQEITRIASLPPLTVATDASKSLRRSGVGIACVSEDGIRRQKMLPLVKSVLAGELLAIELALSSFQNRKLRILSDSRDAIAAVTRKPGAPLRELSGEESVIVDRIHRLMVGRSITFSWIKGHSGHPLNETADRLAVAARRNHEAAVPASVQVAIANEIVAPLRSVAFAA
ncbi:ribonuclease H family protein [Rhodococcus globerulus]|uniref:ribonuclease H family protein n=1 Tax=Rhodococcus globerulus TaxID=33008 RepID=UPI001C576CA3|nr:ribonuclease H family protein [Rhodococcus globerulus]QXW00768.1 RNAse HI domain-containing protein [Rhodococcus globerulus]